MRRLIFSLFIGLGTAFVAWAGSFAVFEFREVETTRVVEHNVVVAGAAILILLALVTLRSAVDPLVMAGANILGVAALWDTRSFPEAQGYPPGYWSALALTTLVFLTLTLVLHSDFLFRGRRGNVR